MNDAWRRGQRFALSMAATLAAACASPPDDPDGVRGRAAPLEVGRAWNSQLECDAGDCADWYRIGLEEDGLLTIKTTIAPGNPDAQYLIVLENGFGRALDQLDQTGGGSRELSRNLKAGFYMVGFVTKDEDSGDRFSYTVEASFEPDRPKRPRARKPKKSLQQPVSNPAPKPRYSSMEAEVLEVEGKLSDPQGILLDVGRQAGVDESMLGELREGDNVIAQIEIVDVYPEGSRARIVGRLRRALTPSIRAYLRIPLEKSGGGVDRDAIPTRTD